MSFPASIAVVAATTGGVSLVTEGASRSSVITTPSKPSWVLSSPLTIAGEKAASFSDPSVG
jgi:hypothetical protein